MDAGGCFADSGFDASPGLWNGNAKRVFGLSVSPARRIDDRRACWQRRYIARGLVERTWLYDYLSPARPIYFVAGRRYGASWLHHVFIAAAGLRMEGSQGVAHIELQKVTF